eukprot:SAG31_NODE_15446_length_754_cov_1.644275_1_plen_86_part_00
MNIYGLKFSNYTVNLAWTVSTCPPQFRWALDLPDCRKFNCRRGEEPLMKDLKATLKQLIKYNNLKIPISKLKKNELISLLIHTEF